MLASLRPNEMYVDMADLAHVLPLFITTVFAAGELRPRDGRRSPSDRARHPLLRNQL